ncbi:MAG: hypothetical protein GY929_20010 [Actinomycetia bacterium]|nr:hypothetical protein [Actinomycetes bacterium]
MGVDVNLYAIGEVSDEELNQADAWFFARAREDLNRADATYDQELANRIKVNTPARFYGPGYERGHWPDIYNMIRCLQAALPGCTVHYGGDSEDDALEVTEEMLSETWGHWLSDDGLNYRGMRAAINRAQPR